MVPQSGQTNVLRGRAAAGAAVRVHRGSRAGCNEGVDSQAFRELAIAEMESLYRMAMRLTCHPEEAQDLVQETYLRALKKGAKFELREPRDPPVSAQNTAQQLLQPDRQTDARTDDLRYESAASELERPAPAWELNHLDWEQVDDRLKHAIEDLPGHYREVLLLWAVERLKYRQIANVMDLPLGTVMSPLCRTRVILSTALADLATEHGIDVEESTGTGAGWEDKNRAGKQ